MLKSFSGNSIHIIAGLAVYNSKTKELMSTVERCVLKFRNLPDREIKSYISSYPVLSFAGGFDGEGALKFTESIDGVLTALPVKELKLFLRKNGLKV